jgi:hypothetical protein
MMSKNYTQEQKDLKAKVKSLQKIIEEKAEDSYLLRPNRLHPRGCAAKSRTGMTEIIPVPRNSHITVLPAGPSRRPAFSNSHQFSTNSVR